MVGLPLSVLAAPAQDSAQQPSALDSGAMPPPVLTPTNVTVNRVVPVEAARPARSSGDVTAQDIFLRRVLAEPLVPVAGEPSASENSALLAALDAFASRSNPDDSSALEAFLTAHPTSPWRVSLLNNLGDFYFRTGQFSRAITAFQSSWDAAKDLQDARGRMLGDQALGQLARMRARIGQVEKLDELMGTTGDRVLTGSASEAVAGVREGLWRMKRDPGRSFHCGPLALAGVREARKLPDAYNARLMAPKTSARGFQMAELQEMATDLGMPSEVVKAGPGAELTSAMLPAVVHWKLDHYAAVLKREGNRFLIKDQTFGPGRTWVSVDTLMSEASGFFLVPKGTAGRGWTKVNAAQAKEVTGRGDANGRDEDATTCEDEKEGGDQSGGGGPMTAYKFTSMVVSLHLYDHPVGYTPPVGPALDFKIMYNQRDANQPVVFDYSNFGPKWTMNLVGYVQDDPMNASADVKIYRIGGGYRYTDFNPTTQTFAVQPKSLDVLKRLSSSPIRYERLKPDGSREIYEESNGSTVPGRKVFLTKIIDPQGNELRLHYDSLKRITAITDAVGQVSTLTYGLADKPYLITRITDPFGRSARFDYDAQGWLIKITDVIGIESSFTYGPGDFVNSLTTPYGTTRFAFGENGPERWLEATDPYGDKERIEFRNHDVVNNNREVPIPNTETQMPSGISGPPLTNDYLSERNTFFWDKKAMKMAPGDYSKARITHWLHLDGNLNVVSSIPESRKNPYESRVWFTYQGQTESNSTNPGMIARPKTVSRVLSDGTTQVYRYTYNDIGQVTNFIDPETRNFTYVYAANKIDLLEVRQTRGSANDLVQSFTYNGQNLPLTSKDAAGQTTTYTYNTRGQLLTVTNPKGEVTTNTYDSLGRLTQVVGAQPGATTTFTYDGFNRVRTETDSEGYTLTYDYDAFDRTAKVTFPDGTFAQMVYDRLDLAAQRDREGRWTRTYHNALRQLIAVRDPSGRTTNYEWSLGGPLQALTDGGGNVTRWKYNEAGQMTEKKYANGSTYAFTYDNASRLATRTDALGQVTTYAWFRDNNPKSRTYSNTVNPTKNVSFTYAQQYNRLTSMTDGSGTTSTGVTTFDYFPIGGTPVLGAGRLKELNGPLSSDLLEFSYDSLGRLTERKVNSNATTYGYDSLGRLIQTTNALGAFTYSYVNQTGRLAGAIYPNGQTVAYDYYPNVAAPSGTGNGDQRLKQIANSRSGTLYSRFDYGYKVDGAINAWTKTLGTANPVDMGFTYDPIDRLTGATYKDGAAVLAQYGYAYDKADNRTTERRNETASTGSFNNVNELTALSGGGVVGFTGTTTEEAAVTVGGQAAQTSQVGTRFEKAVTLPAGTNTVTITAADPSGNTNSKNYRVVVNGGAAQSFTYDANGNLTNDGTRTYVWDAENRLIRIVEGPKRTEIEYDGFHHWTRIVERNGAATVSDRRFIWDGSTLVEQRNGTSTTAAQRYLPQGVQQGTSKFFYTRDHLGSIREVVNNSGSVVARYDYDPYGRRTKVSGTLDSDFGFTGHYYHAPSGLHFAPFRAYSAELGRWISRDPIEEDGGINLYGYVRNDPVNWLDPLGLAPGDSYPDPDSAAMDASRDIHPLTKKSRCEYAGEILERDDGTYTYTEPRRGTKGSAEVYPNRRGVVGTYHSHPTSEKFSGSPGDPAHVNSDKKVADDSGKPNYVVTPRGHVKRYDPDPNKNRGGKETTIGNVKKK
jgi:RHS repeat-associated protein